MEGHTVPTGSAREASDILPAFREETTMQASRDATEIPGDAGRSWWLLDALAADAGRALAAIDRARAAARARVWRPAGRHAPDADVDAARPLIVDADGTRSPRTATSKATGVFASRWFIAPCRGATQPAREAWLNLSVISAAAGHWYASGTFWAAAGVAVALVIGIATLMVTRVPRQRLLYSAARATPLLTSAADVQDLEVRHRGHVVCSASD